MSSAKPAPYSVVSRYAKRTRTQQTPSPSRPILPSLRAPFKDSEVDELDEDDKSDSDYEDPLVTQPAPSNAVKRRGRKPGNLSRSTRESLRKQNHSRIEKARRTKINDALDTLRTLVPDEYRTRCREEEAMSEDGDKKVAKKAEKEQKEFKLEVLVRTVAYLKDLMVKVKTLEEICGSVGQPILPRETCLKRKRNQVDDGQENPSADRLNVSPLVNSDGDVNMGESNISTPTRSPVLPSISSWLPQALADSNLLLASHPGKAPQQLPSPPLSDTIRPRSNSASQISSTIFPSLSLPSPISAFPNTLPFSSQIFPPSFSPASHSPEDESAATLLLHMKCAPKSKKRVQTPGSVLGIDPGR